MDTKPEILVKKPLPRSFTGYQVVAVDVESSTLVAAWEPGEDPVGVSAPPSTLPADLARAYRAATKGKAGWVRPFNTESRPPAVKEVEAASPAPSIPAGAEVWAYGPKDAISGKPWVARVTGSDPTYRFTREFASPARESGRDNVYDLSDGLYEVCSFNGNSQVRYFAEVNGGVLSKTPSAAVEARFPASLRPAGLTHPSVHPDALDQLESEAILAPGSEAQRFG